MKRSIGVRLLTVSVFVIGFVLLPCAAFAQMTGWWRGIIDYPGYKGGGELTFEKKEQNASC